jgi:hypothetical protein
MLKADIFPITIDTDEYLVTGGKCPVCDGDKWLVWADGTIELTIDSDNPMINGDTIVGRFEGMATLSYAHSDELAVNLDDTIYDCIDECQKCGAVVSLWPDF